MKKEILILTHRHTRQERVDIRKRCVDYWVETGIKVVVFHTINEVINDKAATFLRDTKEHVDGYNEIYKYLYKSDLDYALIVDDDVIIDERSKIDLFQTFEENFQEFDNLSPLLQNGPYLNELKKGGFENAFSICARINIFKNIKKHLGKEIYCKSKLLRFSDTEFGIQLMIEGIRLKRCRSVIEKTFAYNLSSIILPENKNIYSEEKKYLSEKYGIKLIKFGKGENTRLNTKSFVMNLTKEKNQLKLL